MYLNLLVMLLPVLIFDLVRTGSLHRAYVYGLASIVPCFLMTHFVWSRPAWRAVVTRFVALFGVADW